MSDETRIFLDGDSFRCSLDLNSDWKISARDEEILSRLSDMLRWWLPIFLHIEKIRHVVDAIEAIEEIIRSGTNPADVYHISARRVDEERGGLSVSVTIGSEIIDVSCEEWVSNPNGTLDCGTIIDSDGRPMMVQLDRMGSFDKDRFEACYRRGLEVGPEGQNDDYVDGSVEINI
ncbi:hypothetical protein [Donghicola eburneus]|uniref:Uncharacterized protein n=1 Tax=Donghicola eburneus TaxID=393278 RepID=A0A1M4N1K1_9RHOB|nr:hypothetical protein [Donghicola eburneus]SCM68740.1 hypothetical protein KARMA_2967 [Donghicola eburneus]